MKENQKGFSLFAILLIVVLIVVTTLVGLNILKNEDKSMNKPGNFPITIKQGLKGTVTLRSGNCMPGTEESDSSCKEELYDVPTKVIIKRPIDLQNKENKELVTEIDDVKGEFEIELPIGVYNMYVIYQGKEYCNLFVGQLGDGCEFSVVENKVTSYMLQINEASD